VIKKTKVVPGGVNMKGTIEPSIFDAAEHRKVYGKERKLT
jgi:hypothetical protein